MATVEVVGRDPSACSRRAWSGPARETSTADANLQIGAPIIDHAVPGRRRGGVGVRAQAPLRARRRSHERGALACHTRSVAGPQPRRLTSAVGELTSAVTSWKRAGVGGAQISLADQPEVAHAAGELKTPDHLRLVQRARRHRPRPGLDLRGIFGPQSWDAGATTVKVPGIRHPASGFALSRRTFRESRCSGTSTSAINSSCSGRC